MATDQTNRWSLKLEGDLILARTDPVSCNDFRSRRLNNKIGNFGVVRNSDHGACHFHWPYSIYMFGHLTWHLPSTALQVFNVFNRVLGFFARSSRIEFDDDWEEKSELAGNGLRLLRYSPNTATTPMRHMALHRTPIAIQHPTQCQRASISFPHSHSPNRMMQQWF